MSAATDCCGVCGCCCNARKGMIIVATDLHLRFNYLRHVQWDMTALLSRIVDEIPGRLADKMSADPSSPSSVFKWLVLAEVLQLEQLRAECVDALGTYLLRDLSKWVQGNEEHMAQLSVDTLRQVIRATVRCQSCVNAAASTFCSCGYNAYAISNHATLKPWRAPGSCSECAFTHNKLAAQPVKRWVCNNCACPRVRADEN